MKIFTLLASALFLAGCASTPASRSYEGTVRTLHVENLSAYDLTINTENPFYRLGRVTSSRDFLLPPEAIRTGMLTISFSRIGEQKVLLSPLNVASDDRKFDLSISQRNAYLHLVR